MFLCSMEEKQHMGFGMTFTLFSINAIKLYMLPYIIIIIIAQNCLVLHNFVERSLDSLVAMQMNMPDSHIFYGLPGIVLSKTNPKNPPMNMWVVKRITIS